jgi:hypothetical protein
MVAEGRTNTAIAERLTVSARQSRLLCVKSYGSSAYTNPPTITGACSPHSLTFVRRAEGPYASQAE